MAFPWLQALAAPLIRRLRPRPQPPTAVVQAQRLIAAVDAGGLPLHPGQINRIARDLGLEVSRRDRPEHTIARIRAVLARTPCL